jgi:hypothetical protein
MDVPWRNVAALDMWHRRTPRDQLAIIATVTKKVGSLSVSRGWMSGLIRLKRIYNF